MNTDESEGGVTSPPRKLELSQLKDESTQGWKSFADETWSALVWSVNAHMDMDIGFICCKNIQFEKQCVDVLALGYTSWI